MDGVGSTSLVRPGLLRNPDLFLSDIRGVCPAWNTPANDPISVEITGKVYS